MKIMKQVSSQGTSLAILRLGTVSQSISKFKFGDPHNKLTPNVSALGHPPPPPSPLPPPLSPPPPASKSICYLLADLDSQMVITLTWELPPR